MLTLSNLQIAYDRVLIENGDITMPNACVTLIHGPSGSGKSTLLYRIGLISSDTSYSYQMNDVDVMLLSDFEKSQLRRYHIGYVMQDFCLFEQYDVLGNLQLYASFSDLHYTEEQYNAFLHQVRLHISLHQRIETLSGGEQQRLAIACALCKQPDILILDEPTSALDKANELVIFEILKEQAHVYGRCVVFVSHSLHAEKYADQIYKIEDGKLQACKVQEETSQHKLAYKKEKEYTLRFYYGYIKYFIRKFFGLHVTMSVVMILSVLLTSVCLGFIDNYAEKSHKSLMKLCNNMLVITDTKKRVHVDENLPVMKQSSKDMLDNIKGNYRKYPYIPMKLLLGGEQITVLPYYDVNDIKSQTMRIFHISDNKGVYISYDVYALMNQMGIDIHEKQDLDCLMSVIENKKTKIIEVQTSAWMKGVLNKGIENHYMKNKGKFIYMYHEDIENIYEKLTNSDDVFGYVLTTNTLDELVDLRDRIKTTKLGMNDAFSDIQALQNMDHTLRLIKVIASGVILIVCLFLLCMVQIHYFYKRDREFALLKINGLCRRHLMKLTFYEIMYRFLISLVVASLLFVGVVIITKLFSFAISFHLFSIICMVIIDLWITVVATLLFCFRYFNKMIPEDIIRN